MGFTLGGSHDYRVNGPRAGSLDGVTERDASLRAGRNVSWWRGLLSEPTVPFLLLALVALIMRDYLPDILLVGASIAVIAIDSLRWRFRESPAQPEGGAELPRAMWIVVLAVALAMSMQPRLSFGLDASFAVIGVAALWVAWLPRTGTVQFEDSQGGAPPRWWLWWVPALLFCLVEVLSLAFQPAPRVDSPAHPSLSGVLEPALDYWPERAVVLLVWFAAGWWLLHRIRAWAQ